MCELVEVELTMVFKGGFKVPVKGGLTPAEYNDVMERRKQADSQEQTVVHEQTVIREQTLITVRPIQAPAKKPRKNRAERHAAKMAAAKPAAEAVKPVVDSVDAAAEKTVEKPAEAAAKPVSNAAKSADVPKVTSPDIDRITLGARSFSGSWADEADEEDLRKEQEAQAAAQAAKKSYASFLEAAKTDAEAVPVVRGLVGASVPPVDPDWKQVEERRKPRHAGANERRPRNSWAELPPVCTSDCNGVSSNMRNAFNLGEHAKICNNIHGNHVGSHPASVKTCTWGPAGGTRACKDANCVRNHLPEREWLMFRAGNDDWLANPGNRQLLVSKGLSHLLPSVAASAPIVVKLPARPTAKAAADVTDEIAEIDVDTHQDTATPGAEETDSSGSGSE